MPGTTLEIKYKMEQHENKSMQKEKLKELSRGFPSYFVSLAYLFSSCFTEEPVLNCTKRRLLNFAQPVWINPVFMPLWIDVRRVNFNIEIVTVDCCKREQESPWCCSFILS